MLKEIKHMDLVFEMFDEENILIQSVFQIYEYNRDRQDFIENLTLLYKYYYRIKIVKIIREHKDELDITDTMIDFINNLIKVKDNAIMGPVELYYSTKDVKELLESIPLVLNSKRKRRASNDLKIMTAIWRVWFLA